MEWRRMEGARLYEVGEDGTIRRRDSKVVKVKRLLDGGPYWIVNLMFDRGGYMTVHVGPVVCSTWHGAPPPGKYEAAFIDGDPSNHRPDNLEWRTPKANRAAKEDRGTVARGERNGKSKLSAPAVRAIRADKRPDTEIADSYGITPQGVRAVKTRKVWGWVK